MLSKSDHETWMRQAYDLALLAMEAGEVPIGAVVVLKGNVIGTGFNQSIKTGDPTAHAEIMALRDAARTVRNYRLTDATLYVTIEPCLMCAGGLVQARIEMLVYGAPEPKTGAVRSMMRALEHPSLNHRVVTVGNVLADECRALIQKFFKEKRALDT